MTHQNKIQFFEQKKVRTIWDDKQENDISLLSMWLRY